MGEIKDGLELGIELLQFWTRFKGRRVRVWPSQLPMMICSASGKKWLIPGHGRRKPYWWVKFIEAIEQEKSKSVQKELLDKYVAEFAGSEFTPQIETVERAKLFEGTISDIVKQPPGLYLTDIEYWVVAKEDDGKRVVKIDSEDEGIFLPLAQLLRIDFVNPQTSAAKGSLQRDHE